MAEPVARSIFDSLIIFPSPNQVLTHAARAAAKPPLVAARGAREGLWLEKNFPYVQRDSPNQLTGDARLEFLRDA